MCTKRFKLLRYSVFLLLLFLHLPPRARSYEASEDKEDVFAQTACPAFLTFINAAYVSGATVELPCLCKPQEVSPNALRPSYSNRV